MGGTICTYPSQHLKIYNKCKSERERSIACYNFIGKCLVVTP